MSIAFPQVPNVPGVPPVARNALNAIGTIQGVVAGVSNTLQFFQGQSPLPPWGIFDKNFRSVVDADSFLGFDNQNSTTLSDFPIQAGGFASYNKVKVPYAASVRISKGGSVNDRANLLKQLDALLASLDLYSIVTPEKSYLNVNLERYDVTRRDKDQAFFLTEVDLFFRQIYLVSPTYTTTATSADTSDAQAPSSQPPVNQGALQPTTPSVTAQSTAQTVLAGGAPP